MSKRRLTLITGASAGIGAAMARAYARRGWDVALTARRVEKLRALQDEIAAAHPVEALVFEADLAEPDAPQALLAKIAETGRVLDGLVNNAGYGPPNRFLDSDWAEQQRALQVMAIAPTQLMHSLLTGMVERGFGRILNVSSILGLTTSHTGHTLYGSIKHYLMRASESLHVETRGAGVHVTALCPGLTRSEFHAQNGVANALNKAAPRVLWQTAQEVAEIGVDACEAGRAVAVTGVLNKALVSAEKLAPAPLKRTVYAMRSGKGRHTKPD